MLKPLSARILTIYYVAALFIIAGLSITSHLMLYNALVGNQGSAAIINLTGRQRMLSQRIASLVAEIRLGDVTARDDLQSAVTEFETAHKKLLVDIGGYRPETNAGRQLRAVYFDGVNPLDSQVRGFVADARRVLDLQANDPEMKVVSLRIFGAARKPLLSALNNVVTNHQKDAERALGRIQRLQWAILGVILSTLLVEALVIFRPMIQRIASYMAELLKLAATDTLTGAANRRYFMEACQAEIARAKRYERPLSLLMLDVDHFKSVNDTHGHAAGDAVLRSISATIRKTVREADICGRLGGEEFAVMLVETPLEGAIEMAGRLRRDIETMTVRHDDVDIRRTVSIGVTAVPNEVDGLYDALKTADALMYRAKQSGRNRVVADMDQTLTA